MLLSLRTRLIALTLLTTMNGCGMPTSDAEADAYVENGVLWAYGSVQLADLDGSGSVMLRRTPTGQALDGSAGYTWTFFGAMLAGDERDLAYVDYHPAQDRLLAYSYKLDIARRAGYGDFYDIYALLRKSGRSYQAQRLYLGTADFAAGEPAKVTMAQGLKLSLIANGVFAGQWALHYPDVKKVVIKPFQGMCQRWPTQMSGHPGQGPGQNPGQNPGQYDLCRPLPAEKDLCGGDPTKDGCRPAPPTQQPSTGGSAPASQDRAAGTLEHQGNDVYIMSADLREAKLTFTSSAITMESDEANADFCARSFYAVSRSVNGRVNQACILTPSPSTLVDGKASCALTIRFDRAQTFLERVCNVAAVFRPDGDSGSEVYKVQVSKR